MNLLDIINLVKEKNLTKSQIEEYHADLTNLYALMQLELAEVRKAKALYWIENRKETDVATGRAWAVTEEGLREIDLSHEAKAAEKLLSSLRSRLYSTY